MDGYDDRQSVVISVTGSEPVPWSVPQRGRWGGSLPNPRLTGWQKLVADSARSIFGPYEPWTCPISIETLFFLSWARPKKTQIGDPAAPIIRFDETYSTHRLKGKAPDVTNLVKGTEDALQGIVFVDDVQVVEHVRHRKMWSDVPGVIITVSRMIMPWKATSK